MWETEEARRWKWRMKRSKEGAKWELVEVKTLTGKLWWGVWGMEERLKANILCSPSLVVSTCKKNRQTDRERKGWQRLGGKTGITKARRRKKQRDSDRRWDLQERDSCCWRLEENGTNSEKQVGYTASVELLLRQIKPGGLFERLCLCVFSASAFICACGCACAPVFCCFHVPAWVYINTFVKHNLRVDWKC